MDSPIRAMKLPDKKPKPQDSALQMVIFNLRAWRFFSHPYFDGRVHADEMVLESLCFRLRPIAMTDSDPSSIWSILKLLEDRGEMEAATVEKYRYRYKRWFVLSDYEVRGHGPRYESPSDLLRENFPELAELRYENPIFDLWNFVYGHGVHSDYRRVIQNEMSDLSGDSRSRSERVARLLALITAIRPLIIDLHDDVADVSSGRSGKMN